MFTHSQSHSSLLVRFKENMAALQIAKFTSIAAAFENTGTKTYFNSFVQCCAIRNNRRVWVSEALPSPGCSVA